MKGLLDKKVSKKERKKQAMREQKGVIDIISSSSSSGGEEELKKNLARWPNQRARLEERPDVIITVAAIAEMGELGLTAYLNELITRGTTIIFMGSQEKKDKEEDDKKNDSANKHNKQ